MRRIQPFIKFIKRYVKEQENFNPKKIELTKSLIKKLESDDCIIDRETFRYMNRFINTINQEHSIFKVLYDFEKNNRKVINKTIYLKFYQFLIQENAYDAYMEIIKRCWPLVNTLRDYMCQIRPFVNPTVTFSASIIFTQFDDEEYWRAMETRWHKYYTDFLKEEI